MSAVLSIEQTHSPNRAIGRRALSALREVWTAHILKRAIADVASTSDEDYRDLCELAGAVGLLLPRLRCGDFWEVAPKGAVPVLVLEDGGTLTENAAVLQYIADLRPELGLAPPAGNAERYRLQEWLSFIGTEIHKAFLFPTFWYANEAAKAAAGNRIGKSLSVAADRLESRSYLIGDRFTVADAYLTWALLLVGQGGVRVAAWPSLIRYLDRMRQRPHVKAAVEIEQRLLTKFSQPTNFEPAV